MLNPSTGALATGAMALAKFAKTGIHDLYYRRLGDEEYICVHYKKSLGRFPALADPELFTEKLQWLKLWDRRSIYTQCADKYAVRRYIADTVGPDYLVPLLLVTDKVSDLTEARLPEFPVIIKATHDSGGNFILRKKNSFNLLVARSQMQLALSRNYYEESREWEYRDIRRRIIVETLLSDRPGAGGLTDYKVHCFNGEPLFVQTISDRRSAVKENWFDPSWHQVDAHYFSPLRKQIAKPVPLEQLLAVAKRLSRQFPYVRVDCYVVDDRVLVGELTFRPYGGFMKFVPASFDAELGQLLTLPELPTALSNRTD